MKRFFKSKGQGLVEYALVLVLVAIVVIAALTILDPIIKGAFNATQAESNSATTTPKPNVNQVVLADASFIKEGINTPYLIPLYSEEYLYSWYKTGCRSLIPPPDGYGLKVGTIYEDPTKITITRDGDSYVLCNNVQGAQVAIVSTFVELPK